MPVQLTITATADGLAAARQMVEDAIEALPERADTLSLSIENADTRLTVDVDQVDPLTPQEGHPDDDDDRQPDG
jgi:hypothetical protein